MTTIHNTAAFANMSAYTDAAIAGGWNVLVRDVPTNSNRRMMDGVRNGVWFQMSVGENPEFVRFRIRRAPVDAWKSKGSMPTYRVIDLDAIDTILSTSNKVAHGKLIATGSLLDREMPIALR